jgi:hypothetical protein
VSPKVRLVLATAVGCALCTAVTGCVSQDVADSVNQKLNHGMSTSELELANVTAVRAARREDARVLTARAIVTGSSASPHGTAAPCTSGRLLQLTLVGHFPHARPGTGGAPVTGQELTVDATTGRLCERRYLTGQIVTNPLSVLLFSG